MSPVPSRRLVAGVGVGVGVVVRGSFSMGSLSTQVAGPELAQRDAAGPLRRECVNHDGHFSCTLNTALQLCL